MMSPHQIFIFYLFVAISKALIITTPCASVPTADCTSSGYCELLADLVTCSPLPCYKINEIGACKDPTAVAYNAVSCLALGQLDLRYDNVCSAGGIIDYSYVRLPIIKTGSPIYSTTGMTLTEINSETVPATRNNLLTQLYSLNLQTATNTQLIAILDLYISYANDMIGGTGFSMTHPYYIEKAIFSALQNLRDDTSGTKDQTTTLTRIWTLSDTLLLRLRTFRKFYATSYFFINFAHTQFSRTYLSVKAQFTVFSLKWKQYIANGYVQLITVAPNQFTATYTATPLSDLIMFNIIDTTGTAHTLAYTLTWFVSDLTQVTCAVETTGVLHAVNRNTLAVVSSTPVNTYCASTATSKRCDIPSTIIDPLGYAGNAFYIACA